MNQGTIIGRLTRDAERITTKNNTTICNFSIAETQRGKVGDQWQDESHFFDCTLIGRRADALAQYLTKGKQVGIEFQLKQDRWNDKNTGKQRSRVKLFVTDIQLLGGKNDSSDGGNSGYDQTQGCDQYDDGADSDFEDDGFDDGRIPY
jgi:single-strand DNA-binding protein